MCLPHRSRASTAPRHRMTLTNTHRSWRWWERRGARDWEVGGHTPYSPLPTATGLALLDRKSISALWERNTSFHSAAQEPKDLLKSFRKLQVQVFIPPERWWWGALERVCRSPRLTQDLSLEIIMVKKGSSTEPTRSLWFKQTWWGHFSHKSISAAKATLLTLLTFLLWFTGLHLCHKYWRESGIQTRRSLSKD